MSLRARSLLIAVASLCCGLPVLGAPLDPPLGLDEPAFGEVVTPPPAVAEDTAEKAAYVAQYDDNEADTFIYGSPAHKTFELAMRFDDVGGPLVTLHGVWVCMKSSSGSVTKYRYEVVVWAANGPGGGPGTELTRVAALAAPVATSIGCHLTTVAYPLTTEDVYIGIRQHPAVDPTIRYGVDLDGSTVHAGYHRYDETGSWIPTTSWLPSYNAFMIRATLSTPGVFLESLLLPFYAVDGSSPGGTTTLFAVRNLTGDTVPVAAKYFTTAGTLQKSVDLSLEPHATQTTNLRDVTGLATDADGFERGFVQFTTYGSPYQNPVLGGDYFQVDVAGKFATGERLVRGTELCDVASIRFLDFPFPGSGTRLTVWTDNPRGTGAGDPPTYTIQVFDEAGAVHGALLPVKTDHHATEIPAVDALTDLAFGTFKFVFTAGSRGTVYAESFADGKFAVGVSSQCEPHP